MIMVKKKDKIVRKRVSRPRKEKDRKTLRQWTFFISVVFFIGLVGYIFFCSSLVSIAIIDVVGAKRVHTDDIVSAVERNISGSKVWCIKNNNYFFLHTDDILRTIHEDQRIKSVDVVKQFPDTLRIVITEYDVVPVWCVGSIDGACFELQDGCIVGEVDMNAPLIHDNRHFVIVDHGHDTLDDGQCVITPDNLDNIKFLGEELIYMLNIGIVQPYVINFLGTQEVRFDTDDGWYILADFGYDVHETLDVAALFMKKVELPSNRSDLEYIDLRFPEKIFYKMKDGVEKSEEDVDDSEQISDEDVEMTTAVKE